MAETMSNLIRGAGRMVHPVTIERHGIQEDSDGGSREVFTPDTEPTWAAIQNIRGRERWLADQSQSRVTHRVVIRWQEVSTRDRLDFQGRKFNIDSAIDPDERRKALELMCIEDGS